MIIKYLRAIRMLIAIILIFVGIGCTDSNVVMSSEELTIALGLAIRGDTIQLGNAVFTGNFIVPSGVTVVGSGVEYSVFKAENPNYPIIKIESGLHRTEISGISVLSDSIAGIYAHRNLMIVFQDLEVQASRGIGIGVEGEKGDSSVSMNNVSLIGPINEQDVTEIPPNPKLDEIATHGLFVNGIQDCRMNEVKVQRFASLGVILDHSNTYWRNGEVLENLGTGLMVNAGTAKLHDLVVCDGYAGLGLTPSYGAVFSNYALVETTNITTCNGEGLGILQDSSNGVHIDLEASGNQYGGIWAQNCPRLEIEGTETDIAENYFAGVITIDTNKFSFLNGTIHDTRSHTRVFLGGSSSSVTAGDALQLVRPRRKINVEETQLLNNSRVGVLVHEADKDCGIEFADTFIDGEMEQLGAIVNGNVIPESIDSGIERSDIILSNDRSFDGILEVVPNLLSSDLIDGNSTAFDIMDLAASL